MHPIFIYIGNRPIYWYGIMMALSFLAGIAHWRVLGRKEGRDPAFGADLAFWIMVSGILGARVAYVLANFREYAAHPASIVRIDQGGLVYYGGFLGSWVAIWAMARRRQEPLISLLDFVITAVPLGHAIGRIGCFLNGCCFGRLTDSFVGVTFPAAAPIDGLGTLRESPAFAWQLAHGLIRDTDLRSLPVQPVQLYEAAGSLCIMVGLLLFYRHRRRYGEVAILFGTLYALVRFFFEFVREPESSLTFGLTPYQIYSVIAFAIFATIFIVSRKSKPVPAG